MRLLLICAAMFLPLVAHAHCPNVSDPTGGENAEQLLAKTDVVERLLGAHVANIDAVMRASGTVAEAVHYREGWSIMKDLVGAQVELSLLQKKILSELADVVSRCVLHQ